MFRWLQRLLMLADLLIRAICVHYQLLLTLCLQERVYGFIYTQNSVRVQLGMGCNVLFSSPLTGDN